jgi:hypothetical protein
MSWSIFSTKKPILPNYNIINEYTKNNYPSKKPLLINILTEYEITPNTVIVNKFNDSIFILKDGYQTYYIIMIQNVYQIVENTITFNVNYSMYKKPMQNNVSQDNVSQDNVKKIEWNMGYLIITIDIQYYSTDEKINKQLQSIKTSVNRQNTQNIIQYYTITNHNDNKDTKLKFNKLITKLQNIDIRNIDIIQNIDYNIRSTINEFRLHIIGIPTRNRLFYNNNRTVNNFINNIEIQINTLKNLLLSKTYYENNITIEIKPRLSVSSLYTSKLLSPILFYQEGISVNQDNTITFSESLLGGKRRPKSRRHAKSRRHRKSRRRYT